MIRLSNIALLLILSQNKISNAFLIPPGAQKNRMFLFPFPAHSHLWSDDRHYRPNLVDSFSSRKKQKQKQNMKLENHSEQITSVELDLDLYSYGGDYAGHMATFHASTGKLIRVPEHLVPESMIEWGQIPGCLEVITSEDLEIGNDNDNAKAKAKLMMKRATVSILPEVGCGVDNLETTKKKASFLLQEELVSDTFCFPYLHVNNLYVSSFHNDVYTGRPSSNQKVMLETAFCFDDSDNDSDDDNNNNVDARRIRMEIDILLTVKEDGSNVCQIAGPLRMYSERKTSKTSTHGEIAEGGGLDGRTVTRLIGSKQVNKPFTERADSVSKQQDLVGSWGKLYSNGNNDKETISYSESDLDLDLESTAGRSVFLHLPLGIIVKYDYDDDSSLRSVEISKMLGGGSNTDTDTETETSRCRVVCARKLQFANENESGTFSIETNHWLENLLG